MENRQSKLRQLVTAALFAAILPIFIWFVKIPIPSTTGYVHLGDSVVYLAAYLLPMPYAVAAAAVGGLLADLCVGAVVYALPTAVIKALMAFIASWFFRHMKNEKAAMLGGFGLGAAILTAGYFAFELVVWGLAYAATGLVWNLVQGISSGLITVPMVGMAKRLMPRRR